MEAPARLSPQAAAVGDLSTADDIGGTAHETPRHAHHMTPELRALAGKQDGVFLRAQAVDAGYTEQEIRRLKRSGEWANVRRGAYAEKVVLDSLDDAGLHKRRVRAVVLKLAEPTVVSHNSAAVLLDMPHWGIDLERVHVTRPEQHAGRIEAGVSHHEAAVPPEEIVRVGGLPCTDLARTALDVGREFGFLPGVVAADAALQRGVDADVLAERAAAMSDWPNARVACRALRCSDPGAESPGESLSRVLMAEIGMPRPRTQVVIRDGDFVARVDFLIEEFQEIVEFDGRMKYQRMRDPEDRVVDDGDVVWAEKQREDRLRELGFTVVRLVWADLFGSRRALTAKRLWRPGRAAGVRRTRAA